MSRDAAALIQDAGWPATIMGTMWTPLPHGSHANRMRAIRARAIRTDPRLPYGPNRTIRARADRTRAIRTDGMSFSQQYGSLVFAELARSRLVVDVQLTSS